MLEAKNIGYAVGKKWLVKDISYRFMPGKCYMICGPNGAGKSTFLKLLSLELSPASGSICYNNELSINSQKEKYAKCRAVLSQNTEISFPMDVEEIVMMGRYPHFNISPAKKDHDICEEVMENLGVTDFRKRNYLTLSGGEKQRVQFARVLTQIFDIPEKGYRYLLLDEPISSLDLKYQFDFLHHVRNFINEKTIVIAILHDLNLALNYSDEVLLLNEGGLFAAGPPADVLHPSNIKKVFHIESSLHKVGDAQFLWVRK
ncbi:MAG TPA: heme ABC transporter ATP-binding protein [Chitinophagaceae bacterium]|nr:heme ABC transporter ATP-binding protein [Chitinophagaceae bacterium]